MLDFYQDGPGYYPLAVFCSPLFTLIGALPFFLNNLLIKKIFSFLWSRFTSVRWGLFILLSMHPIGAFIRKHLLGTFKSGHKYCHDFRTESLALYS